MLRTIPTLLIAGLMATATACGDNATTSSPGGDCPEVKLGERNDAGDVAYASVDNPKNVDCATAQKVVKEWGAQNVGLGPAHLPAGWSCDDSSGCRNGDASVTMTLRFE